jgi:hypothetical protein
MQSARLQYCHLLAVTVDGHGFVIVFTGLVTTFYSSLSHRLVISVTVLTSLLITASNGGRCSSSGFPNSPDASATATLNLFSNQHSTTLHRKTSTANCPAYKISARTVQKMPPITAPLVLCAAAIVQTAQRTPPPTLLPCVTVAAIT